MTKYKNKAIQKLDDTLRTIIKILEVNLFQLFRRFKGLFKMKEYRNKAFEKLDDTIRTIIKILEVNLFQLLQRFEGLFKMKEYIKSFSKTG